MARRGRGFIQRGARRLTQWIGPAVQGYVTVATGGATLISSLFLDDAATIVRTRGMVSVQATTASVSVDITGAIGIGIVSEEAFQAGIASIPEPFTDADWGGWMVWRSFGFRWEVTTDIGRIAIPWSLEIDSKAMRKMGPNERLVVIAESQAGAFSIFDGTRTLIKLS